MDAFGQRPVNRSRLIRETVAQAVRALWMEICHSDSGIPASRSCQKAKGRMRWRWVYVCCLLRFLSDEFGEGRGSSRNPLWLRDGGFVELVGSPGGNEGGG